MKTMEHDACYGCQNYDPDYGCTRMAFDIPLDCPKRQEDQYEKVVRCKNCKHFQPLEIFGRQVSICGLGINKSVTFSPDFYCGYGEEKEESEG